MNDFEIETNIILKTQAYLLMNKINDGFRETSYRSFVEEKGLTEEYEKYMEEKRRQVAKGLLDQYTEEEKDWLREHQESFKKKWREINEG